MRCYVCRVTSWFDGNDDARVTMFDVAQALVVGQVDNCFLRQMSREIELDFDPLWNEETLLCRIAVLVDSEEDFDKIFKAVALKFETGSVDQIAKWCGA